MCIRDRMVRTLVHAMKPAMKPEATAANGARGILYIMDTLGLSGRTKGYIDLALHLDPARYRPVFCSLDSSPSELAERLRARNVPIEFLPLPDGLRPDGVWR